MSNNNSGFTLIEMVIVITVISILAGIGVGFITQPIVGFISLSRRAELVDTAENALRRMQRDVRQALPNSIRLDGTGKILELLNTAAGGRYRRNGPGDILDFTGNDSSFDVIGQLNAAPSVGQYVVVYNIAASGTAGNAYSGNNRTGVGAGSSATRVNLNPAFKFPLESPYQRFFIVDEAVTYYCDTDAQTLTRYAGYTITNPQPTSTSDLGDGSLMADKVSGCSFTYDSGASKRSGMVTLDLTIEEEGEKVHLLQQIHVSNAP